MMPDNINVQQDAMFYVPLYKIALTPWREIKSEILRHIGDVDLNLGYDGGFYSDYHDVPDSNVALRGTQFPDYCIPVWNILFPFLYPTIKECLERELSLEDVPNMWVQKYWKGNIHTIHNHGSIGYVCVLYLKYNPEVHKPIKFYAPFQHFFTGSMLSHSPEVAEGDLYFFPAVIPHTSQYNDTDEERMVLSFNMFEKKL